MRDIPVGNGSLLVNFDDKYQIRDVYFPQIGQENQTKGFPSRFGLWVDGDFSWTSSEDWSRELSYRYETLVTDVRLINKRIGISVECSDTVASHENIFLRCIRVTNLTDSARSVRAFLHNDFRLYESKVGDTVYYDPETHSLIHYQKNRYFLINTEPHFDSFATGRKDFRGQEGTWRDAEDGELQGGAITEGSVDSTIGVHFELTPRGAFEFFYWLAAAEDYEGVERLNRHIHERRPHNYFAYTENYWRAWVNKNDSDLSGLKPEIVNLFKRSLLIIHTQIDNGGAILAANDHDVTLRATDHYSYLWTRDGAFVANALDRAGFSHLTRKFFDLCGRIVHPKGYFLQKYNADGTMASGWHPAWDIQAGTPQIPIQEDETALVLWALWEHYDRWRDIEFAHRLYRRLIVNCAEFMASFIDAETGLPMPSWNLWEDRRGIHTFTSATVVAGLRAAANFAALFAENEKAEKYRAAAESIVDAMAKYLYSNELGRFYRSLESPNGEGLKPDPTIDASLFGIFYFGCFPAGDERVKNTMLAIEEKLTSGGGIARFENDGYMRTSDEFKGNPWFVCTLWLAEYYIAAAETEVDLQRVEEILLRIAGQALPSGVLAEQMNPITGEHISVSPLTWSHSTYAAVVMEYLNKRRKLIKC